MANEVYQFQVKNTEGQYENVTLGKGSDANDAFISIKETTNKTITGWGYAQVLLQQTGEKLTVILPVTSVFTETNWVNVLKSVSRKNKPWPVINSYYQSIPIVGFVQESLLLADGNTIAILPQTIEFIRFYQWF